MRLRYLAVLNFLILFVVNLVSASYAANLTDLLELAKQNPAILEAKLKVAAAKPKIERVQSLPDPMLELGYSHMMDQVGPTVMGQQSFPYPGKLSLMGRIAETEVNVLEQELAATELRIQADTKRDFYTLFFINKSIENVNERKKYLKLIEETAASRYSTGLIPQTDLLKSQTELSMVEERLTMLSAQQETVLARIKRQDLGLSIDTDVSIEVPTELSMPEVKYSYDQLLDIAVEQSPMLKMRAFEIAMQSNEVDLAKREFAPDFVASLELMNPQDSLVREYNAKLGIMLPLYKNKKQKNAVLEAQRNLAAQKKAYEVAKQETMFMLKNTEQMLFASDKLAKLYKTTIIPQADLTLESAFANYQVGKIDILMLLDNVKTLLDNELKYYEQVTEYNKAFAEIEQIVGRELEK